MVSLLHNIQRWLWHLGWYICLSMCVYVVNRITTPCLEIPNSGLVWHDITIKCRSKRGPRLQRQFAFPHLGSPRKLASLGGSTATTIQYRAHVYVTIILCGTIAQLKTIMSSSCLAIYLHLMRSLSATQLAPVDWVHCWLQNSLFFCFNKCYQSLCSLFSGFNSCVLDYMSAIGGGTCVVAARVVWQQESRCCCYCCQRVIAAKIGPAEHTRAQKAHILFMSIEAGAMILSKRFVYLSHVPKIYFCQRDLFFYHMFCIYTYIYIYIWKNSRE